MRPEARRALAHRRPEYPLSGCVPAEPDSVSPGKMSIAIRYPLRQSTNRPRSRLRSWLRTQILDMRWQLLPKPIRNQPRPTAEQTAMLAENAILDIRRQLLRKLTYPPLTPNRPHSSHASRSTSSTVGQHSVGIQQIFNRETCENSLGIPSRCDGWSWRRRCPPNTCSSLQSWPEGGINPISPSLRGSLVKQRLESSHAVSDVVDVCSGIAISNEP